VLEEEEEFEYVQTQQFLEGLRQMDADYSALRALYMTAAAIPQPSRKRGKKAIRGGDF